MKFRLCNATHSPKFIRQVSINNKLLTQNLVKYANIYTR
jgi:hypothetical protein